MSTTIQRDKQPKGGGKAPAFQVRIAPELKEQFEVAARDSGMILANWLKTLGRYELLRLGIQPKA